VHGPSHVLYRRAWYQADFYLTAQEHLGRVPPLSSFTVGYESLLARCPAPQACTPSPSAAKQGRVKTPPHRVAQVSCFGFPRGSPPWMSLPVRRGAKMARWTSPICLMVGAIGKGIKRDPRLRQIPSGGTISPVDILGQADLKSPWHQDRDVLRAWGRALGRSFER
jgi:hypothetical protein